MTIPKRGAPFIGVLTRVRAFEIAIVASLVAFAAAIAECCESPQAPVYVPVAPRTAADDETFRVACNDADENFRIICNDAAAPARDGR